MGLGLGLGLGFGFIRGSTWISHGAATTKKKDCMRPMISPRDTILRAADSTFAIAFAFAFEFGFKFGFG